MSFYQTRRTCSGNMKLLGSILFCLAVVSAQNRDTLKLNEIETNSKNAEDISGNDNEKAASVVSVSIKELKPKQQEENLEALSTTAQKSVVSQKSVQPSTKSTAGKTFGRRSSKMKEEVKTEASHRGERYVPIPKAPHARSNPEFESPGRAQIISQNAAPYEKGIDHGRQEQHREVTSSRPPTPNAKRMGYAAPRNFDEPAHLHSESADYDHSRGTPRSNVHHAPQAHPRQGKDYDASYDERDDECSKSKSRSVSEEDESNDRYPRQSSFRHRIQDTEDHPQYEEYADDYSYRPRNAEEARSYESRERSEEEEEYVPRERRPYEREQRQYSRDPRERRKPIKEELPRQPTQKNHEQYLRERVPQGRDQQESVSRQKDSVSQTLSISKSFSEPRKPKELVIYERPNPGRRPPAVYQPTRVYAEDESSHEDYRSHRPQSGPTLQNPPTQRELRGSRQSHDNPPRKPVLQQTQGQILHEHPRNQQYERGHTETRYQNQNTRDTHDAPPQYQRSNPASEQQQQELPHHHPYHHHAQAEHRHPHSRPREAQPYIVEEQAPPVSQNQRQDIILEPHQPYDQHSVQLQSSLRENRNHRAPRLNQNYEYRSVQYAVESGQAGNAPTPNYNRDYAAHTDEKYRGKVVAQAHRSAEPSKSSSRGQPEESYYPIQDSGISHHAPSSSGHGSARLPESGGANRPQVSVSYSESSYKNGRLEEDHRYAPEKSTHFDEYQTHPKYHKPELSSDYAKTPVPDQYERPALNPNNEPEKPQAEYQYAPKATGEDDRYGPEYSANQNPDYGYHSGPPAESYQEHPRDDYESAPPEDGPSPHGVLSYSFLKDHPDISDKAKIIVAEPVPGKPGVLLADGARAIIAGNMRGKSISHDDTEPQHSSQNAEPEDSGRERNYGIAHTIPGSFAALVNTDPKFLRKLPEMMYSGRESSRGGAPAQDSEAYYSGPQDGDSKVIEGRKNYESKEYKGQARAHATELNNYGTAHGIVQDHGDGVRSMMYHIRPNRKNSHKLSPSPDESQTSEQKHLAVSSKAKKSEKLHYAKSETVVKISKPDKTSKSDEGTIASAK